MSAFRYVYSCCTTFETLSLTFKVNAGTTPNVVHISVNISAEIRAHVRPHSKVTECDKHQSCCNTVIMDVQIYSLSHVAEEETFLSLYCFDSSDHMIKSYYYDD